KVVAAPIHVAPVPKVQPRPTFIPDVNDYYPDSSRRNNEEGRALVNVCVDTRGRVATVKVSSSTGHPMLDEAALKVAKAFRFKPATQGGKPVDDCVSLPVKFVLTGG
ncbi:MAG TPA: energy transducer TonB, partial [Steroidobacteraceae bacterium]|nr:energy transducer TonB [Steroidobacteraceae bacterium]